jgi:LPS-assembly protein
MVGSGEFRINPRWTFGWDVLYQTDKNFSRTYQIGGFDQYVHRSEVYLSGLNERNYFDLRFMRFEVQEQLRDEFVNRYGDQIARNDKQPWVLPSFDYSLTPDQPVLGGELNIDINALLRRNRSTGPSTMAWTRWISPTIKSMRCAASRAPMDA